MSTLVESTPSPAEGVHAEEVLAMLGRQLGESATVGAVFGSPIVAGERTVVPVARVSYGFGGGGGTQAAPKKASRTAREASEEGGQAAGAGMGGGGGLRVEPLAVVEITARRVRIQPIVDVNRLIGRVFTTVFGFALAALAIRVLFETRITAPPPPPRPKLGLADWPPFAARLRARLAA